MVIYVDFDHTLFNTTAFVRKIEEVTSKKISNIDIKSIPEISEKNKINLKEFLYEDSIPFLEKYKDYNLVLLTKGDYEYQEFKVLKTNLSKYFKEKIITEKEKGDLEIDYQKGIFIDDNPREIESIMKNNPYLVIRMKRGKYKDIEIDLDIENVSSLSEINL